MTGLFVSRKNLNKQALPALLFGIHMKLSEVLLEENVGGYDLFLRALIGSALLIALVMDLIETYPWDWIAAIVAFGSIFSAIIRHCTPYYFLGINTAKK
ncbi:DUF2892 domain-containing protein [Methanohalophilus sp.]|uniref:YgaP family membrane protein n=1 Tax=Methanohalophilus sp. TaxID=1966352 RepID=UPI00262B9311|nr:DUF2892 domain-containing protein [Methanohalophilus sp.]